MKKTKKIARKLIFGIVIFSGMLSIVVTAIQLYFEFQRDRGNITAQLNAIKLTSLPSLNEAVWLSDKDQIAILLSSIQKNQDIEYVELTTDEGEFFHYGDKNIEFSLIQVFELIHDSAGIQQKIGSLLIKADLNKAYDHLYDRIGFVLISNTLKTFLVALFFYFFIHAVVIKYLVKISDYVRTFKINDNSPLKLSRGNQETQDELGSLAASVNIMVDNLNSSVEKLKQSEEKNRLLLESTADAIYGIDSNGDCIFANPACIKLLGYNQEDELLGKNMHTLIHHSYPNGKPYPALNCRIGVALKENAVVHEESEVFWRKDGTAFEVEYRAQPIFQNGEITGVVVSFTDISEKLEIMRQLNEAHQQAETANQAKSDFLANMSHEIRTPMNAILGMTALALEAIPDKPQRRYLERIDTSATLLLGIINDILDFSKIEAGKLKMEQIGFQIGNVIEDIVSMSGVTARQKELKLNIHLDKSIPMVLVGDSMRLSQILLNLVNNAIKFTATGSINVHIDLKSRTDEKAELVFRVIDTGIGLSRELQIGLFDAFSQADISTTRQYGGTGLGLTICKHLVTLMNGSINVESTLGKGSTFEFNAWFCIGTQDMLLARDDLNIDVNLSELIENLRGSRILLVEDNEINQEVATELLTNANILVDIANNGQEAVDKLSDKHKYDGVLMDIQMPIMDGYEATNIIRFKKRMSKLPIIAMTANAMRGDREKCQAAGMDDYISKPVKKDELFTIIARWIKPKNGVLYSGKAIKDVINHIPIPILPGIDVEAGLTKLDQNRKLYYKLLFMFRDGHANFVDRYKTARNKKDNNTAKRIAHTFKTVTATLGAENLRAPAAILEQQSNNMDLNTIIDEQLELIEINLPKLISAIEALEYDDENNQQANMALKQ